MLLLQKLGHKLQHCRQRKAKSESANATQENAFIATTVQTNSETTWIANLGATCHITNNLTSLYDVKHIETLVTLVTALL